jgi:hypothetical protein
LIRSSDLIQKATRAPKKTSSLYFRKPPGHLAGSDPAFVERTWNVVMEQMQSRGNESSRKRYTSVFKSPACLSRKGRLLHRYKTPGNKRTG